MEAPKCKICGERHYGLCPASKKDRLIVAAKEAAQIAKAEIEPGAVHRFDKVTYQRNYMRKRRAAEKALEGK